MSTLSANANPTVSVDHRLRRLTALSESALMFFASPLGPVSAEGREFPLPRFFHLSPRETPTSLRVAVFAGFDHRDLRPVGTLLHVIERLLLAPGLGDGVNLSFFPLVAVLGHATGSTRDLAAESWTAPASPEIELLAADVRRHAHDVFARLDHASDEPGLIIARVRGFLPDDLSPFDGDLLLSDDFAPLEVRFERDSSPSPTGPLSLTDDLGRPPVELHLSLPSDLGEAFAGEIVFSLLRTLLDRYRAHQAYGQYI